MTDKQKILFFKYKRQQKCHPSRLKTGLLPVLFMNWIFGLNIIEYPLGKPKPIISLLLLSFLWSIYGYTYYAFWREFSTNMLRIKLNTFQFKIVTIYYSMLSVIFIVCMAISLYNSEVINSV